MNPILAYIDAAKFYLIVALAALLAAGFWWHGHAEFKAGKAAGDAEVVKLKASYKQASTDAANLARSEQQAADAASLVQAQKLLQQAQAAQAQAKALADTHRAQTVALEAKIAKLAGTDKSVETWLSQPIPSGVLK